MFALSTVVSILSALGFGLLTYSGFDYLISSLVSVVKTNWTGVGGALIKILDMAGFTDALGYSISAITTKSAMVATKRFVLK